MYYIYICIIINIYVELYIYIYIYIYMYIYVCVCVKYISAPALSKSAHADLLSTYPRCLRKNLDMSERNAWKVFDILWFSNMARKSIVVDFPSHHPPFTLW